jgi:hypothetical protein
MSGKHRFHAGQVLYGQFIFCLFLTLFHFTMPLEIITKEDLEVFRINLLNDIKNLLASKKREEPEWLRCSDVRRMLKISIGTLQKLRISGKLKFHKVGGIHFYKRADVESMLGGEPF